MLIPNSDYVEKEVEIAEFMFLNQYGITFDTLDELDEHQIDWWLQCVDDASHILHIAGIEQDITA
jgi:hypothetical protein